MAIRKDKFDIEVALKSIKCFTNTKRSPSFTDVVINGGRLITSTQHLNTIEKK